jgi:integrase
MNHFNRQIPETPHGRTHFASGLPEDKSPCQGAEFPYSMGGGRNQLKSSLCAVQKWKDNETVKARLKLRIVASMTDGGYHSWASKATIIRRTDIEHIHDYAREHCSGRDYLILRLPMKVGLRTGEIASFRIENINFDNRSFQVLDSKQKGLYPLPLDVVSLQLIQDLIRERLEGYVFTRERSWKNVKKDLPLSVQEIWHIIHNIGLEAGVKDFKPRTLRQYFAANWAHTERKSLPTLQQILRHKSLETTQVYINKLVFFEDVQAEFDGVRNGPLMAESVCKGCSVVNVCKYAPLPDCVEGCRFKQKEKEMIEK